MGKNDFYTTTSPEVDYYSDSTTSSEVDMRQEVIDMFDGKHPQIAKAQDGLLRRMRTDSDGDLIPCECVDSVTGEQDKDRFCPICYGSGFYWDEEDLQFYQTLKSTETGNTRLDELIQPGLINIPLVVFYTRYDCSITRFDKIVRLELDTAGDAVIPYKRRTIYRIENVWDYRADNSKLEYWKIYAHKEDVKYLNAPAYSEI